MGMEMEIGGYGKNISLKCFKISVEAAFFLFSRTGSLKLQQL